MGDLVRVHEKEFFPADMVILNTTEAEGALYVETKNLDGETNLKLKSVPKDMFPLFKDDESFINIRGTLNIEEPNNRIYKFDGNFDASSYRKNSFQAQDYSENSVLSTSEVPLSNDNVALRGMSLRNTEHVTGIVVYTGHDSKI